MTSRLWPKIRILTLPRSVSRRNPERPGIPRKTSVLCLQYPYFSHVCTVKSTYSQNNYDSRILVELDLNAGTLIVGSNTFVVHNHEQ